MFRLRCYYKNVNKNLQILFKEQRCSKATSSIIDKKSDAVSAGGEQRGSTVKTAPTDVKPKARLPLVKTFFLGEVDKDLLAFPEVIVREDMTDLQNAILPFKGFFKSEESKTLNTDTMNQIKDLGLYGTNAPIDYDGKGWDWSASLIASEPESDNMEAALALLSHRVIIDILKEQGNESHQKFLQQLTNGELVGAEAIFEYNVPEFDFFNTKAKPNLEDKTWVINGEKAYVVTGPLPEGSRNLFLVIAQTQRPNVKGDAANGSTLFLVDAATPGVKLGELHSTISCNGLQMRRVQFQNITLPDSCVIGEPFEGGQAAETLVRSQRLRMSMVGLGLSKAIVQDMAKYCVNNKQCGVDLKDLDIVRTHLSKSLCTTYALESMIYYTAGLLDEFKEQDVGMEVAITKCYGLTNVFKAACKWMDMLGPKSILTSQATEKSLRKAAQLYAQGESMDTLRLFIAVTGLQHAGVLMQDNIRKFRNPLFHPGAIFDKIFKTGNVDEPKTNMRLGEALHPSLDTAAQLFEHSVARLHMSAELLLTRYGTTILEQHNELNRTTEIVMHLYAMFASLSRASRSYCIGLTLSKREVLLASSICIHGHDRVKVLVNEIFVGEYTNNDTNLRNLANELIKNKSYFPEHPLTYNF
ncbi:complex I assembly factor ACAD9, mitochondrial-like [Teleopsis dalmanni]|uniref:complex I assembly factor ACAD9, mitochondrial-like n=1 Tax=Teleopsis dalmanni TaxID=139649 RepID=UPI0018CDBE63|nr:complex I assembly factor ACAD9, mitochondrial-like [Teleopsis dalmanni]